MKAAVTRYPSITWFWGDGTSSSGINPSHTFSSAGSYQNSLLVSPASALVGFGADCANQGSPATTLSSISGLTNYPKLADLLLVNTHLTDLSLLGCSNLTHIALVHTSPSTNTENAWFADLAQAQQAGTVPDAVVPMCNEPQHYFYCPANPGATNRSAGSPYWNLTNNLGWTIIEFGSGQ